GCAGAVRALRTGGRALVHRAPDHARARAHRAGAGPAGRRRPPARPSSLVATAAGHALGFVPAAMTVWAGLTLSCVLGGGLGRRRGAPGVRCPVAPADVERAGRAPAAPARHAPARGQPRRARGLRNHGGGRRLPAPALAWFLAVTS